MYDGSPTAHCSCDAFDRPAKSFFGAMAGFILLDAVLLLWLLNPFAGLAPRTHAYPLVDRAAWAAVDNVPESALAKPSPFGSALTRAGRGNAGAAIRTAPAFVEVNR